MVIRSLGVSLQIKALNYSWSPDGYWMLANVYLRFYTLKTGLGPIHRLFVYIESDAIAPRCDAYYYVCAKYYWWLRVCAVNVGGAGYVLNIYFPLRERMYVHLRRRGWRNGVCVDRLRAESELD